MLRIRFADARKISRATEGHALIIFQKFAPLRSRDRHHIIALFNNPRERDLRGRRPVTRRDRLHHIDDPSVGG